MAENIQQKPQNNKPGDSEVLGARATGRVLLIASDGAIGEGASALKSVLETGGHSVAVSSEDQAATAISMTQPDLVMFDVGDKSSAIQTCRVLRGHDSRVAMLAVLENSDDLSIWPELQDAGFDDWTAANVSSAAIESRIGVLLRLAQTGRDLDAARTRLARYMQVDEPTQLLNRRFFFQSAHREASRARRYGHALACLMIDIDHLEETSKMFGDAGVEYVLRAVAYTVRQWTRDSDICGRFNERKFVVLLPETDIEGAMSVRGKILDALDDSKFEWEGQELPISVFIGEAERKIGTPPLTPDVPDETIANDADAEPISTREELASLLEDADAALSVAKSANSRHGIFVSYVPGQD